MVKGHQIQFVNFPPVQKKKPYLPVVNAQQEQLIQQEIQTMLEKGAIQEEQNQANQFLSVLFLVEKKDGGQRPVINLKKLNKHTPYIHFKMEGLYVVKDILIQNKLYDQTRSEGCHNLKGLSGSNGRKKFISSYVCVWVLAWLLDFLRY